MPNITIRAGIIKEISGLHEAAVLSILIDHFLSGPDEKKMDISIGDLAKLTGLSNDEIRTAIDKLVLSNSVVLGEGQVSDLWSFRVSRPQVTIRPIQQTLEMGGGEDEEDGSTHYAEGMRAEWSAERKTMTVYDTEDASVLHELHFPSEDEAMAWWNSLTAEPINPASLTVEDGGAAASPNRHTSIIEVNGVPHKETYNPFDDGYEARVWKVNSNGEAVGAAVFFNTYPTKEDAENGVAKWVAEQEGITSPNGNGEKPKRGRPRKEVSVQ